MYTNQKLTKIKETFDLYNYVHSEKNNWEFEYNRNQFARFVAENFDLLSSWWNIFQFHTSWKDYGLRKSMNKYEVEKLVIELMEELLEIENIKTNDKTTIISFLLTHCESEELRNKLEKKVQEWNLLFLSNKVINITTREEREYQKDDFALTKLPYGTHQIESDSLPLERLAFLDSILDWWESPADIAEFLQEYLWWLLVPSTKYEKALLLRWSGSNWKWCLVETIKHVVWEENSTSLGLHEINKDQNLHLLLWKLVFIDSDLNNSIQLDSWIIKKLVSWEAILAKEVYKRPICFTPYARLLLCTNSLPYIKNIDKSISRRFVFLHLKKSFTENPDPNLKIKLKKEAPQIFARAIQGLKRLEKRWHFDVPKCLKEDLETYIKESDSVEMFLQYGNLQKGPNLYIPSRNLFNMYEWYCRCNWYKPLWSRKLIDRLEAKWYEKHRTARDRWILGLWWDPFEIPI